MESSCCKYKIEQMNPEDAAEAAAIEAGIFSMPWSENGFRTSVLSRDTLYLCVRDGDSMIAYCGFLQTRQTLRMWQSVRNIALRELEEPCWKH